LGGGTVSAQVGDGHGRHEAEQGFGDVIQFVRFIPQASARAGQVIIECQCPLKRLFEYARFADRVIAVGETPPPFDYYIPVMSLPLVLGTTLETIPRNPWLLAPAAEPLPGPTGMPLDLAQLMKSETIRK